MTLTRSNLSSHPDSIEKRAYQVAEELAGQLKGHQGIAGWGVLKNGRFVFTLIPRN